MEAPAGPSRFKRPLDFSAGSFSPAPPFSQEVLQDQAKELWLIRAPANFSPESLDGHSVPLLGFRTLKAPQPGGTEKIFHVQTALEHLGGALLLLPSGQGGRLTCSPPFSGSLSVCERYGDPGGNQLLSPVAARPAPQVPAGLRQRFLPFGSHLESAPLPGAVGEPPRKKMKKKKHRLREEEEEASKERPPLFGMPWGGTTGAGEAEARGRHEVGGAAPLAAGSQPGSAAVAQDGVLLGEPEDPAPLSKKKKKKKRKEEMEAEAEHGHEDPEAPPATDSQPSCTVDAQNSLLSGEAEDRAPLRKKKKRKEGRERKEEMGGEAETGQQHEDGAAPPATDFRPSSAADAQNGLLSGEAEDRALLSKNEKKKKRRKEDRGLKEETGEEAGSAARPHEGDSTAWGALSPEAQPASAAFAHDGLLSGEAEAAGPGSKKKKKKKRKEGRERKEEMGGEAEAANLHRADGTPPWAVGSRPDPAAVARDGLLSGEAEDLGGETEAPQLPKEEGAAPWGTGSQPHPEAAAQEGLLSGSVEDPGPRSKKKKRKDNREVKEEIETEAALPPEENGTASQETGSQISSGLLAQDSLLSMSRKKKKKRKEEAGGEAGGLPGPSSWPGRHSLPGVEEVAQGAHEEEAMSPELFSSQGDAAGVWRGFSGPGPVPEGELVLAEQPGVGSSSHKAKKKKRKKEKEEPGERPAQQGAEGWAELGAPLGGGGGGQEAEPGREELSRKRKKKEHRRQQAAEEERLAGLEEEVENA